MDINILEHNTMNNAFVAIAMEHTTLNLQTQLAATHHVLVTQMKFVVEVGTILYTM